MEGAADGSPFYLLNFIFFHEMLTKGHKNGEKVRNNLHKPNIFCTFAHFFALCTGAYA
jgi:hypothetical protein